METKEQEQAGSEEREQYAERDTRTQLEESLQMDVGLSPRARLAVIHHTILVLEKWGLVNHDATDFTELLASAARELEVPFLETYFAAYHDLLTPEVTREHTLNWLEWCQRHAPERLAARKDGE